MVCLGANLYKSNEEVNSFLFYPVPVLITDKTFASAVVVSSPVLLTRLLLDMCMPAAWANPDAATPLADSL